MKNKLTRFVGQNKAKVIILSALLLALLSMAALTGCEGCATWQRSCKTCQSEMIGGLDRTVNVYAYNGDLIATHSGRIDIEENESKVLFDLDGKRYIYYNAIVEVIEN